MSWTPGSVCPPKEEVWRCLDEYLDNMKLENCDMNEEVVNYAFRRQPSSVRAQDFEIYDFEETKRPYSGHSDNTSCIYRKEIPISLKEKDEDIVDFVYIENGKIKKLISNLEI